MELLQKLFSSDFLPHGSCYLWKPGVLWLHVISDSIIAFAYYSIPFSLIYLVRKRRDFAFNWIFWMFTFFILGCGTAHLMDVITVWHPVYLVSGMTKALTATLSLATALALIPLLPKMIALPSTEQLQSANLELQAQVAARAEREQELTRIKQELEQRVQDRTGELQTTNLSLQREISLGVQTQQALRASQARLSGVIESAMDAILTVDERQRILLFNRAAEEMFGCNASEALGQPLDRFVPDRYRSVHAQHVRRFGETGVTARSMGSMGQLWALRADGTEFPIEASISATDAAGKKLFTVILRDVTERLRSQRNQSLLAAIVESTDSAVFAKDLEGVITSWNRGAEQLYGYRDSEIIGKHVSTIVPPELREEEEQFRRQVALGQKVLQHETLRMRSNGSLVSVSLILSPLRDANGAVTGLSTIAHDISGLKRAEQALRQNEERLRLFIEHAPAALAMFDRNMRYLQASNRWKAEFGLSETELRGASHYETFPGGVPDRWREAHRRGLAGEVLRQELDDFEAPDGSKHWLRWEVRPWHDSAGEIGGIIIFCEDITARTLGEIALRESEERFEALANGIPQLAWMADSEGYIFWYNQRWYEYTGTTLEQMQGWGWQSVHDPAILPRVIERWKSSIHDGKRFEMEFPLRGADGQFRMFLTLVLPLKDSAGGVVRWFGTNTDISAIKKAEERLAESQAKIQRLNEELEQRVRERTAELENSNRELEAFTYSVSHDLRAPLRHIAGFSKMLGEECGGCPHPEGHHYLQRIQEGTQRMGLLIDDLLNFTRIGRQELAVKVSGLEAVVKEAISDLKPDAEGREVEWRIGDLPFVEGDSGLLKVVFQNLLSNALKYTRPRPKAVIEVGTEQFAQEQVVFVRDNGVGFDMKYADKLFGVFQRLHRAEDFEGTGVGLAMVQRIVHKHGGRIWAQAELDRGATFYLTLGSTKENEIDHEPILAEETS